MSAGVEVVFPTSYTQDARLLFNTMVSYDYSPLIVGGGGSMNPVLLAHIADCLPGCQVLTNEQLGLDSSAKEAVAFAVLANEALYGCANNAPGATGAAHGVVMGKISL